MHWLYYINAIRSSIKVKLIHNSYKNGSKQQWQNWGHGPSDRAEVSYMHSSGLTPQHTFLPQKFQRELQNQQIWYGTLKNINKAKETRLWTINWIENYILFIYTMDLKYLQINWLKLTWNARINNHDVYKLRAYSWLCVPGSLWQAGGTIWDAGDWQHVGQMPPRQCYCSALHHHLGTRAL